MKKYILIISIILIGIAPMPGLRRFFTKMPTESQKADFAIDMYSLGLKYYNGAIGVEKDRQKAIELFTISAKNGHAEAQQILGSLYMEGSYVAQDYQKAIKWYRLAADQDHAHAQYHLGLIYLQGVALPQNYEEAADYFRAAAIQRHADAQYYMGLLSYMGMGVEQNRTEAFHWFQDAVQVGQANAMYYYAYMLYEGVDVKQDFAAAYYWASLASYFEVENAKELKNAIKANVPDQFVKMIDSEVNNVLRENRFSK